eukprot:gene6243-10251_t
MNFGKRFKSTEESDDEEDDKFVEKTIKSFLRKTIKLTESDEEEEEKEELSAENEKKVFIKKRLKYDAIFKIPELENAFYTFLTQEFNSFAFDFLRECDKIEEDVSDEDHVKITEYFYETYIKVKAKKELNLSGKRRNKIIELLEDSNQLKLKNCWILSKKPKELLADIYEITKAELGTENFPRFIVSPFWRNIAHKYQNNMDVMEELNIYNNNDEGQPKQKINSQQFLVNKSRRVKEGKSKEEMSIEYLNFGIDLFKKRDFQEAYDMFSLSIHLNEKMKESYFNRGILNFNTKNYIESIKDMTIVLETDKNNAKAYAGNDNLSILFKIVRGMCLKNLEYFDVAIIDLKKSLKLDTIFKNYMILGICYDNLDDIENALKNYSFYLQNDSETPNAMSVFHNRGQLYFQTMRFELALDDFTSAFKICDDEEWKQEFNLLKGKCKEKLGVFEDLNIDEFDFDDMYNRSIEFFQDEKLEDALKIMNKIIKHSKEKEEDYHYLRGLIYKKLKKNQKAIRDFKITIELNSKNDIAMDKLITLLIDEEKFKVAEKFYEKLIQIQPSYQNYYNRALFYYHDLKNKNLALEDLTKTIELNSQFSDGFYSRGLIYLKDSEYENAISDFDKAVALKDDAEYLIERALCLYDTNRVSEAIRDIENAISLDLNNKRANSLLHQMQNL